MKTFRILYRLPANTSWLRKAPECLFLATTVEEAMEAERRGGADVSDDAAQWSRYEAQQAIRDPAFFQSPLRGEVPRPETAIEKLCRYADRVLPGQKKVEGLTYGDLRAMLSSADHRALVTVEGGVAQVYADAGVLADVFDWDEFREGARHDLPRCFADLARHAHPDLCNALAARSSPDPVPDGKPNRRRLIKDLFRIAREARPGNAPANEVTYAQMRALLDRFSLNHRVLAVVNGGVVTEVLSDPGVEVAVFDWDNHREGDVQDVPEPFAGLARKAGGVPVHRPAAPEEESEPKP